MEWQWSDPNNGSVSHLPLRNVCQIKRIGVSIGIGSIDGVPPGGTDTQLRMASVCSVGGGGGGGGGGEKGIWHKLWGSKMNIL